MSSSNALRPSVIPTRLYFRIRAGHDTPPLLAGLAPGDVLVYRDDRFTLDLVVPPPLGVVSRLTPSLLFLFCGARTLFQLGVFLPGLLKFASFLFSVCLLVLWRTWLFWVKRPKPAPDATVLCSLSGFLISVPRHSSCLVFRSPFWINSFLLPQGDSLAVPPEALFVNDPCIFDFIFLMSCCARSWGCCGGFP